MQVLIQDQEHSSEIKSRETKGLELTIHRLRGTQDHIHRLRGTQDQTHHLQGTQEQMRMPHPRATVIMRSR
jgi:hypothetical protein